MAEAAGLHCSRIDGSALRYNCEDVYLPDLLICPKQLAGTVLAMIAELPQHAETERYSRAGFSPGIAG